jgi:hypothetical protein
LQALSRPAVAQSTTIDDTEAGRWVWILVLMALGVEWIIRRGSQSLSGTHASPEVEA